MMTGSSYEPRGTLVGSNQAVNSLDFDSTGTLILGTSNDFASRVWSISDHRLRVSFRAENCYVLLKSLRGFSAIKILIDFIFKRFLYSLEKMNLSMRGRRQSHSPRPTARKKKQNFSLILLSCLHMTLMSHQIYLISLMI